MINNHHLTQKETAQKLGVTPAAVCQYVSGKRGKIRIIDKKILQEIDVSANNIIEKGQSQIVLETCRICKIMRQSRIFSFFCNACDTE
jgi:predicted transcriptional regulator